MDLRDYTRQYCDRDNRLAALSYFGTFAVYFLSLWMAINFIDLWYILAPAVTVNAFSVVRLYVLQHDTGHQSLFETRVQNDLAGHVLSPFTLAPFTVMKHNHNLHHAYQGNLEHRGTGEINIMTLDEWNSVGFWQRLYYRLYRNPLILIPVGAMFTYFIRYRWPKNTTRFGVTGVLLHNVVMMVYIGLIYVLFGMNGVLVWFGSGLLGGMIGVFLVYLQHNFEDTYWDKRPELNQHEAAIQGSSCLDFGWLFDFAVANITLHDIHHLNARIPSYRLRRCHHGLPLNVAPRRIKFPEAVAALQLKLWDESRGRLVPFPR
jgi:omega-6 fatty acid desaturase (delta-12 desaturase)